MALRPQQLAGIGLLALLPVLGFLVVRGDLVVAFAVVNVVLIVASVYYMLSPVSDTDDHAAH